MNQPTVPSVLFVCVKNSGKSQMAAGLMRKARRYAGRSLRASNTADDWLHRVLLPRNAK